MLHSPFARARWLTLATISLSALLAQTALGQLPHAQLTSIFPPGGKIGTEFEVTVSGQDLDDATQLLFSIPQITATLKMSPPTQLQPKAKPAAGQFVVKIAPNTPPGIYEARVVSRFGLSNPRAFAVGTLEEVVEKESNNSPEKSVEVPVGTTFSGRVDASNYDYLKVPLKAGQRVLLDCVAERVDSRMNPTLVLLNPAGKELDRMRDTIHDDPVLEFTAPADGIYMVKIYDAVFAGGADYFYRLNISSAPFIDFVFPPSGAPGSNDKYTLYGRNLPGGQPAAGMSIDGSPLQKLEVNIALPADAMSTQRLPATTQMQPRRAFLDGFEYRHTTPQGTSNPIVIYYSRGPRVAEQEPNDTPAQATKVTLPCEIVGQFYPQHDLDYLQFDAKKGEHYSMEVISHRLGLDADPYLTISRVTKDDKGVEQVKDIAQIDDPADRNGKIGSEFDTSTDDPAYSFTVPDDGTYRLMIRDQFGDGRMDPSYVYRLAIRPSEPDFRILVLDDSPSGTAQRQQNATPLSATCIHKGGATSVPVTADRRDGFDGEIEISIEGLPAGVTCQGAILGGGADSAELVLQAADNAAAWAGPLKIVGKAKIDGKDVVREARYCQAVWGTTNRQQVPASFRLARQFQIAVIDKELEPAEVKAGDGKIWETARGGNLEIPVTLTRRGDFNEAVKLTAAGLPNEIKPKEINLAAGAKDGKLELQLNQQNIKSGSYTFYLRGDTKRKYIRNPEAIPAAEADQKDAEAMVKQMAEQVKAATAAKDAAVKAATEATNAAAKAEKDRTAAAAVAKQKADANKQAADNLNKAKEAAAKDAANEGLKNAVTAAQKAADDAASAQKTADEQLAAATKTNDEAQAKTKPAADAKTAAEAALKAAQDMEKQATQMKQQADKVLADAKKDNAPKDLNFVVVSSPIKLRIVDSPLTATAANPGAPLQAGAKAEVKVNLKRLYGFADAVELTLDPTPGVQGLSAAKVTVAKDQGEGKLELAAAANATPGEHTLTIKAKGRFNNINFETPVTVVVKVEPAPPAPAK